MRYKHAKVTALTLTLLFLVLSVPLLAPCPASTACGDTVKWAGVDETVIEKIAREHGREARRPLIATDRGDLLLLVFLLAGATGGFAGGYYWRKITEQRVGRDKGE